MASKTRDPYFNCHHHSKGWINIQPDPKLTDIGNGFSKNVDPFKIKRIDGNSFHVRYQGTDIQNAVSYGYRIVAADIIIYTN
ncbi:hypothetical protein SY85_18415 [Flavisolibacter tropicus]|uniref:Uncharacterized protein n=1 Tax=Flavisolibacter tropicus TaxID=1492898 RepID=A0A172TZ75_9BACT|nr:hypothetical protein SY85_18415 [Flavisolibacter tropicus]